MRKKQHKHKVSALIAIAIMLMVFRCAGQTDSLSSPSPEVSLLGGWSYESALFACFRHDHKAGFGDHKHEALAYGATWDDNHGVLLSGGESGTWNIREDGKLEVFLINCQHPDCEPNPVVYAKDDSLGCSP